MLDIQDLLSCYEKEHEMLNQAKGLWTMAALVVGLCVGFSAAARTEAQEPVTPGAVECVRDSDCTGRCGEPGADVCESGRCTCTL
jgi:hypothetical protein